ncbi:uncharacterized protein BDR25DRAFT_359068 [Lindgomyces ingoldianus]|uniref:Uncharacterized protein n=1 Tax=Lindgomyces ingoldianus TaxID=673940 RepID=A0ACB6QJ31_9PLEO|nr:uncharacterized protein BDR25DRAFT_359068 [Lindgomyces ingoldianus]KAF2467014.1 hypothetical protein BDR25DRAFT_359068 [Lindgomyces ingoldianus]
MLRRCFHCGEILDICANSFKINVKKLYYSQGHMQNPSRVASNTHYLFCLQERFSPSRSIPPLKSFPPMTVFKLPHIFFAFPFPSTWTLTGPLPFPSTIRNRSGLPLILIVEHTKRRSLPVLEFSAPGVSSPLPKLPPIKLNPSPISSGRLDVGLVCLMAVLLLGFNQWVGEVLLPFDCIIDKISRLVAEEKRSCGTFYGRLLLMLASFGFYLGFAWIGKRKWQISGIASGNGEIGGTADEIKAGIESVIVFFIERWCKTRNANEGLTALALPLIIRVYLGPPSLIGSIMEDYFVSKGFHQVRAVTDYKIKGFRGYRIRGAVSAKV